MFDLCRAGLLCITVDGCLTLIGSRGWMVVLRLRYAFAVLCGFFGCGCYLCFLVVLLQLLFATFECFVWVVVFCGFVFCVGICFAVVVI